MKNASLLILNLMVTTIISLAQTNVGGGIFSSTTWSPSGNPYIVTDSITVFPGVILTIEPGTDIQFSEGTHMEVRGKLLAIGTTTDSISLSSTQVSNELDLWEGILITFNADSSHMSYCKVSNSKGISGLMSLTNSRFTNNYRLGYAMITDNCHFENGTYGFWSERISNSTFINLTSYALDAGVSLIDNCKFFNNGVASEAVDSVSNSIFCGNWLGIASGANYVSNCVFSYNETGLGPDVGPMYVKMVNSEISNNNVGIMINDTVNLSDNYICDNTTYGVQLLFASNVDLSNNCWCTNDSVQIAQQIYDGYDNVSLGLVSYSPYTTCDSTAILDTSYCDTSTVTGHQESSTVNLDNLSQNAPNPFSSLTRISFTIKQESGVTLTIYDMRGRQVAILVNERLTADDYTVEFIPDRLPHGIYHYQLRSDSSFESKKMVLIK